MAGPSCHVPWFAPSTFVPVLLRACNQRAPFLHVGKEGFLHGSQSIVGEGARQKAAFDGVPFTVDHAVGVGLAVRSADGEGVPIGFDDVGLAESVDVLKGAWRAEGDRIWSVSNNGP